MIRNGSDFVIRRLFIASRPDKQVASREGKYGGVRPTKNEVYACEWTSVGYTET